MFPFNEFLLDLGIFVTVFTVFVMGTMFWKPRIWLHDFPEDIQALTPPKTKEEERLTTLLGTPFIVLFFGLPVLLAWDLKSVLGADFNFQNVWIYAYALFFGANLWDLVALDFVGFALVDPDNPPIPGTEGAAGWKDYGFHIRGFMKGSVMGLLFATFVALMVTTFA